MDFRKFFNRSVFQYPQGNKTEGTPGTEQSLPAGREGTFVTEQALFSFSGMTASIALANAIAGHVGITSPLIGALLSLAAGIFLFYVQETDPKKLSAQDSRLPVRVVIAVINTMQIYAAVYGIGVATGTSSS